MWFQRHECWMKMSLASRTSSKTAEDVWNGLPHIRKCICANRSFLASKH